MAANEARDGVRDNVALTPVFCIADISPKTIEQFIDELEEYQKEEAISVVAENVYIVTSDDKAVLQNDPHRTRAPIQPFKSPFIGHSLDQLRLRWRELIHDPYINRNSPFTERTFIVLDDRSEEDGTCIIISESIDKGEARAAFAISTDVLCAPEVGTRELNEGLDTDQARDPRMDNTAMGGGILYTRDYFQRRRKRIHDTKTVV